MLYNQAQVTAASKYLPCYLPGEQIRRPCGFILPMIMYVVWWISLPRKLIVPLLRLG